MYLRPLDSMAKVQSLVAFYVAEHNSRLPHSAFRGQKPDEMYFGTGAAVPDQLASARNAARVARLAANRAQRCAVCARPETRRLHRPSSAPDASRASVIHKEHMHSVRVPHRDQCPQPRRSHRRIPPRPRCRDLDIKEQNVVVRSNAAGTSPSPASTIGAAPSSDISGC